MADEKANTAKKAKKNDKVLIMVPRIEGEKDEKTVCINGVYTKIKRGTYVEVPRAVASVLINSERQNSVAVEEQERMKMQVQDLG